MTFTRVYCMYLKNILLVALLPILCLTATAQNIPLHSYMQDDTILKAQWIKQVAQIKESWINKANPELKKEYESIYQLQFSEIEKVINSKKSITAREPYNYLQQILAVILKANPELKSDGLRLFFSRDWWPNAYSMGDGTIVINAGLMVHLNNESELAFVLCHELAHFYKKHTQQGIDNYIKQTRSNEFQQKLKTLSKQTYGVNQELDKMVRSLVFDSRHHSRSKESEADLQAFSYFVKTGYSSTGIISLLHTLDTIDHARLFPELNFQNIFTSDNIPFKRKWIQSETTIFSQMGTAKVADDDSLKTHPDCLLRIAALTDSVKKQQTGSSFLVNEAYFKQLKQELLTEMIEYCFQSDNISRNLYYNLQLLQQQEQLPLASWAIARDLNKIYSLQKNHQAGLSIEAENKAFPDDYNLLLRFLNRIRLDELSVLTNEFCKKYLSPYKNYELVNEQLKIAEKNTH